MFSIFIGRHFECWKRYILLAYCRRNNLCSSLTLINLCYTMIVRRATEKDPKFKIRRRNYIKKIKKIKRGVKRPNTWWGIGQWECVYPISLSGHARWPRTVNKSEIYQNLNWFASLLASSEFWTAEKQKHMRMLDTKYSINNSWRKFKRNGCLINVCKSIG
jgi:hypothetical protein